MTAAILSLPQTAQSPLTHADLHQFTGDDVRYKHSFNRRVIYTPGVQYLAQKAHAYWLIDAIVSYYGSDVMNEAMKRDERLQWMHFWRLDVKSSSAVLFANADAGEPAFITQEIPFTDFPLDHIEIWSAFDGNLWTLFLPSEH